MPIDREKMRSIGQISRRYSSERITEGQDATGERWKTTTDELGNRVTERAERQDVVINAPHVSVKTTTNEER